MGFMKTVPNVMHNPQRTKNMMKNKQSMLAAKEFFLPLKKDITCTNLNLPANSFENTNTRDNESNIKKNKLYNLNDKTK